MKTSTLSGTFSTFEDDIWTGRHWLRLGRSTSVPYDRREECQLRIDGWVPRIGYNPGKNQRLVIPDDAASLKIQISNVLCHLEISEAESVCLHMLIF